MVYKHHLRQQANACLVIVDMTARKEEMGVNPGGRIWLREMLFSNKVLAQKLALPENRIEKHDGEIEKIFVAIRQLMA